MADITLGDLLTLICTELTQTLEQTADSSKSAKLHVSDVDLEIPAHLRLQAESLSGGFLRSELYKTEAQPNSPNSVRLMVGLPSTRETPPVGRLGRIRITIEAQQLLPPKEPK